MNQKQFGITHTDSLPPLIEGHMTFDRGLIFSSGIWDALASS